MNDLTPEDVEAAKEAMSTFANEHVGDQVYHIREYEGKGWDGPRVKAWGKACETVQRLRKEGKI